MTSGLGNIQAAIGTPNASGGAAAANGIARPTSPTMGTGPMMGTLGNIGSTMQQAPSAQPPMQPQQQGQNNVGATIAGLHPQASAALRAIPRETMQHLTQAGLLHPGVMAHMYGNK
jgi:hypothetical protein